MNDITADKILETYYEKKPRLAWAMSEDVLKQVRRLKKSDGEYIWTPDLVYNKPGTMVGLEIIISQAVIEPGFELVILHEDGSAQAL
jgi:HK97 family phage major capsid protein